MSTASKDLIPQNERVLQVLTCIARHGEALSARELVEQTGLPLSTLYRQLAPLKKWGLVQEHAQTGLYEPGPLAVQLARGFDQHSWLMNAARDELAELVQKSGESVGLLAYVNGQVVCLDMQESQQALRCSFAKGRASSSVRGASAKALLAYLPPALQDDLLAQNFLENSPLSSPSLQDLQTQLNRIREQRYATSENEVDLGIWGVSAPVFSGRGKLEATLSLMAPAQRIQERKQEFINMTLAAADRLSRKLQHP
ncbi:IclR family transcriptional regulator [Undibacterium pigrum]|uniref:IclR family transcriptional regulator n=1 Tax=Undibacterium pigrum TaxID=401470 RepID=A0A318IWZ3_9BURK|nr:IclR family transcriptional regulator [Undibacterium pigrum]PXX34975.1 IclR family transcriptional regulator [Undibacterium pigrum]